MEKSVLVIWDDPYHPEETYYKIVYTVFGGAQWRLRTTRSARDLLRGEAPDLAVCLSVGRVQGDTDLSMKEQGEVAALVRAGMGLLFVHAGLACIADDTPFFELALGRFASHPSGEQTVVCRAMPGIEHPILRGVEPFAAEDEAYFCKVDLSRAQPFFAAQSAAGTEVAGWTQCLGEGRTCALTPGHSPEMLQKMERLLKNAAAWCVKEC